MLSVEPNLSEYDKSFLLIYELPFKTSFLISFFLLGFKMLSLSHTTMPALSTSNLGDIWRSKKQQPIFQWCKISEREKSEMLKENQAKKRTVQIISRTSEMNPDVKPFHPRNKGLARSEGLWEMYCNQSEPVVFDHSVKNGRSSWPDARAHENGEESRFHFRLYGEKDFWGYVLPNTLLTQKRSFSWGLSVPTDWQSPVHLCFPVTLFEDELNWEDSSVKPKSALLDSFNDVTPDLENGKFSLPENAIASEILEKKNSSTESEQSSDVTLSRCDEDKTKVSSNLSYSMKDLLFGTPRSDSRKRRKLPGISRIMNESCNFYKSNSPPVLTVL